MTTSADSGRRSGWTRLDRLVLGLLPALLYLSTAAHASPPASPREAVEVRSIFTGEFGFPRPAGLTYLPTSNALLIGKTASSRTRLLRLGRLGRTRSTLSLPRLNSSTLAFDSASSRIVAMSGKEVVIARAADLGVKRPPVERVALPGIDLRAARGAAFDPLDGAWVVLDGGSRTLARVTTLDGRRATPSRTSLRKLGASLRGPAYNPADRLLYVANVERALLYALDRSGKVRKTYGIRNVGLRNVTGMVFAPSADTTDRPGTQHLYVADAGGPTVLGRVVELSLNPTRAQPVTVTGKLVRTIQTSRLSPPSPDPSGVTYDRVTDTLLIADSEVDEMPIYRGANLFTLTRTGSPVATGTTLPYSREPSGISLDPRDAALYVADDDKNRVFVFAPGPDGRHGTPDDTVTWLGTAAFGSLDPEGVEIDPDSGRLFIADGVAAEIYGVDPVNGVFGDGDDTVTSFDVSRYGVRNCEGVGYDPRRKTLLVVDDYQSKIFELTTRGALVRIISLATIPSARWLASVTVAPTYNPDDNPSAMSYWVVDRGIDNNSAPTENDGKIYEVVLP